MSIERLTLAIAAGLLLIVAGCRGGLSIVGPPETPLIQVIHAPSRSVYRVYAPPGSLDAGSAVVVDGAGTHSEMTAEADGGLLLEVDDGSATSTASQLPSFAISYVKDGVAGQLDIAANQIIELTDRITKPLFSTGAGPNDMVFGNDSLYVANSFDNTVLRYSLDGEEIDAVALSEGASPCYLAVGDGRLVITTNGSNEILGVDAGALGSTPELVLNAGAEKDVIFPGFGQPVVHGGLCYVTTASIESFGPTVYGEPERWVIDFTDGNQVDTGAINDDYGELQGAIRNVQFGAWDSSTDRFLFVATGELQFDENWVPYATSSSYLLAYCEPVSGAGSTSQDIPPPPLFDVIELGPIGAGRIAVIGARGTAFIGNSLNGNLYEFDTATGTPSRGESNPIVLTEEFTYISDVAFTPDGRYVLATSFNTDELYVIDAYSDEISPGPYPEPFDLSLDPELMAGVANVEVDPAPRADGGYDVYVLYGVANAVAKIELF